ncbi:MAG: hypothetical protein JSW64_01385 [Candidatus Zixiibacteriota bacterium]|nr:MAG: hypothetical protein JSW64_01385 [candidate division Zixibacteria bacterium]
MGKITAGIILVTIAIPILAINAQTDDETKTPTIIGGKIWGGSDTLDLLKNGAPDSITSSMGDTIPAEKPEEVIDWSSDDVIELAGKEISSKTDVLKLKLSVPITLKFVKDAPVKLVAESGNPEIIAIGEGAGDDPEKGFTFPLSVKPGKADLYLYYRVVCCTKGLEAACFFKESTLKIPLTVGDFTETDLIIRHEIEN